MSVTREQAWDLLTKYNQEPFHLRHAITVEHVMGWFAQQLGYGEEKEFWSIVGLLHDLDYERWPEEHCEKSQELMREAGVDEAIIRATASHGWGHRWRSSRNMRWRRCSMRWTNSPASSGRLP